MKRFAMLLLPLLIAGVVFGASDRRAQKLAEERASGSIGAASGVEATMAGWVRMFPEASGYDFRGITLSPSGKIWVTGFNTASALDYVWWSNNGGASWSKTQVLSGQGITNVAAVNDTEAVFGTFDGRIFRTTNGGTTWAEVYAYNGGAGYMDGIQVVKGDTIMAMGDADASGLLVALSVNRGATWTRLTNLPTEAMEADGYAASAGYRQAMSVYNRTVWMALYFGSSRNPRLLKTTDLGATWSTWEVPLTGGMAQNYYFRSINFVDDSLGFGVDRQISAVSGNDHWVHKTTNGGLTWSDTLSLEPGLHANARVRSVKPVPGTTTWYAVGWAGTSTSKAWVSTDNGSTWSTLTPGTSGILTNSAFLSPSTGYVVGNGIALKYSTKNIRNVTFKLNTATVPDTIPVTGSTIQMRGGVNHAGGWSPITWGNDAQNNLTRVGGDYWSKTVAMQEGDTLRYKYVVAYATGTGWEQGVVPGDAAVTGGDRSFIVPANDTTVQVEFWNNGANTRPQYFRPWTAVADSYMVVYFRVNMGGPASSGTYNFNNTTDVLTVRGGGPAGSDLSWGALPNLARESAASNGDGYTSAPGLFWSAGLKFPKSGVTEGSTIEYKYLIGDTWGRDELGGQPNRSFTVPIGKKDTTLYFSYFNNEKPSNRANPDTVALTFRVNLAQTAAAGGVDVLNDTVQVRSGYFTTAQEAGRSKRMIRVAGSVFQVTDTVITAKGKVLDYQYYVVRGGLDIRESYYNFYYTGPTPSEAERRQFSIPTGASLAIPTVILDTATSVTQARRQPMFPNGRKLARNVNVRYEVDLRPAYYQLAIGRDTLFDIQTAFRNLVPLDADSVQKWGVWINGLAVGAWSNPTGGDWGVGLRDNLNKKMYDDGTNGDRVAGDSIWSRFVQVGPDSVSAGTKDRVGQIFKFGIYGGDNEGGRGGFGNNHAENIVDTDTAYTLNGQFGSINPAYYDAWDYDLRRPKTPTGVLDESLPLVYELGQNYPNPFNPSTRISFSIPAQARVELKVYNLLGQEVATLVNEVRAAGVHNVRFNGSALASGVYIYRLTAGDFNAVKKMVLVK